MITVSTILAIYKEPIDWIEKSVKSIVEQERLIEFKNEIIIVLDNPTRTDEIEVLITVLDGVLHEHDSLMLIKNKRNIGLAMSLNKALESTTGEFIARLDADDVNVSNRYSVQIDFLRNNPSISLCGSAIYRINEEGRTVGEAVNSADFSVLKHNLSFKSMAYHPTWFARRVLYTELNGYRNIPAAQDLDFLLRAVDKGYILSNCEEKLVYYRINNESISIKKSLIQKKCQRFIVSKYKSGVIQADINQKELLSFISFSELQNTMHMYSQKFFAYSSNNRSRGNMLLSFFQLCLSAVISKEQFLFLSRVVISRFFK